MIPPFREATPTSWRADQNTVPFHPSIPVRVIGKNVNRHEVQIYTDSSVYIAPDSASILAGTAMLVPPNNQTNAQYGTLAPIRIQTQGEVWALNLYNVGNLYTIETFWTHNLAPEPQKVSPEEWFACIEGRIEDLLHRVFHKQEPAPEPPPPPADAPDANELRNIPASPYEAPLRGDLPQNQGEVRAPWVR